MTVRASSLQPPAVDPTGANPSRYPSWVLLDDKAYIADHENATTARAKTSTGHDVKVTFCLAADPPAVSYFCVHCPGLDKDGFTTEPQVVSSANDLVLLCFVFRTRPLNAGHDPGLLEYFVYKAAAASDGGKSSLRPVQYPPPLGTWYSQHNTVLLPGGDDDDSFFLVDLSSKGGCAHYDLHVFSSETNEWSTTELRLPFPPYVAPQDMPRHYHKVISLGGAAVGWVDLWRGIVVCDDVFRQDSVLRFISLPKAAFDLRRNGEARSLRDVTYRDGFINFIEIEHLFVALDSSIRGRFKTTENLDYEDVIYETELHAHDRRDNRDDGPVLVPVPNGWKIRTCVRSTSCEYLSRRHSVHVDDISFSANDNTQRSELLPRLWDCLARKRTLRNLTMTGFPTFGVYGNDDMVYLVSKVEADDTNAWILGIDLGKKTLEVIKPYSAARATRFDPTFLACAFSQYLDTTPTARPSAEEIAAADYAQNGVLNGHPCSGYTIPNNVQPQQNTWNNWDGYYRSWDEYGYGTHPGHDSYQQPTPFLQPQFISPPNLPRTMQPMSSSNRSGYLYARWTEPDFYGRMWITEATAVALPFAASMPPMTTVPCPPHFAQPIASRLVAPCQSFFPLPTTSTADNYVSLSHGQRQHVKPFPPYTYRDPLDYYYEELY